MVKTKTFAEHKWAWLFANTSPTMASMADAVPCLNECFALRDGRMTATEFYGATGHAPHGIRAAQDGLYRMAGQKVPSGLGRRV